MTSAIGKSQLPSFKSNFFERSLKKLEDLFGLSDEIGESRMFFNVGPINSKEVVVQVLTVQCLYCQDIGAVELKDDVEVLVLAAGSVAFLLHLLNLIMESILILLN